MNDVLSFMGGGGYGGYVSPVRGGATQSYPGIIGAMLEGLYQKKFAPRQLGTNKFQIASNQNVPGHIDAQGIYHSGAVNGGF